MASAHEITTYTEARAFNSVLSTDTSSTSMPNDFTFSNVLAKFSRCSFKVAEALG